MSYRYLASPYSHPNSIVRELRFRAVELALADMLKNRIWTYSPIVHCHALANKYDLPKDFEYWQEYNETMLNPAACFVILTLPGWDKSVGVGAEQRFANDIALPVMDREPVEDETLAALRQLA